MTTENYDPINQEKEIIEFWENNKVYEKIKARNKGKKKFYFLQGPPYTSGRLHMGHAWNNSLKDVVLRYKRMKGLDVWDRAGYDMHGLPTELKVQELFGLKAKEDIVKFGLDKFAQECRKWSVEKAADMDKDLWRLGVWMDYENAYYPIDNDFMENEWWLIKTAHEKGRLYEGKKTISWCSSCATALAKHECEYKEITEQSIFVKFKIKNTDNEYFIIWTTTPWTLAFNMAIMVNPELDYVKCKVDNEVWIVASKLAGPLIQSVVDKKLEVIEEFKGEKLAGKEYIHPWENEIPYFKKTKVGHPATHTIILSDEYVDTTAGSGLVHCAPGCGPEDYEVGHRNHIPPFNNINENGIFPKTMGKFSGLQAKKDDKIFIESLKEINALVASTPVSHDYAHCWRCKEPVVFRATTQWFFRIEDLIEKMVEANREVHWVPKQGSESLELWTKNLRDDSITKQRFWGTPVPIWICENPDCKDVTVIGSTDEIKKLGAKVPKDLHKPWIDEVTFKCEKCGNIKKRLPDVLDVWIDSGTTSWNCLYYPKRKDLFEQLFPADFILEAKEQTRLWFSMLLKCSMLTMDKHCYTNVYMHGMLLGVDGIKMSKSLGNIISPYEIVDKHGADTMRYYLCGINAGQNINFSWDEILLKNRNLSVLWNLHRYLIELRTEITPSSSNLEDLYGIEERYIISKLHNTIKQSSESMEKYLIDDLPNLFEELFLELSRTYIQQIRDKVSVGTDKEKEVVVDTIQKVLTGVIKIASLYLPFITEKIYQNLKEPLQLSQESVHLEEWPSYDETKINLELEDSMDIAKNVIQSILGAREKAQLGLRWPVKEIVIESDEKSAELIKRLQKLIKQQTNVKTLLINERLPEMEIELSPVHKKLGPDFGQLMTKAIEYIQQGDTKKILSDIKIQNKHEIEINGTKFDLKEEHIKVSKQSPEPYILNEFKQGHIFLNTERDQELDNEGYSRELMRRVQTARKNANLVKTDKIKLHIKTELNLEELSEQIGIKVGATSITINNEPSNSFTNQEDFKIKEQEFSIYFSKE